MLRYNSIHCITRRINKDEVIKKILFYGGEHVNKHLWETLDWFTLVPRPRRSVIRRSNRGSDFASLHIYPIQCIRQQQSDQKQWCHLRTRGETEWYRRVNHSLAVNSRRRRVVDFYRITSNQYIINRCAVWIPYHFIRQTRHPHATPQEHCLRQGWVYQPLLINRTSQPTCKR